MGDARKPTVPDGAGMGPEQRQPTVPDLGDAPGMRHPTEPNAPAVPAPVSEPQPAGPHGWAQKIGVGSVIADRYVLKRKIGSGGMGAIYLAEHTKIGKQVAVKVLDRKLLSEATALARFLREAKAASQIGHPNVCDVTDYGEIEGGGAFFAMEYLAGENLHETLQREGRLPWSRVAGIARQLLMALAAAHERNIVHRDMKPANVFLLAGTDDVVKVLDFGIAKVLHSDPSGASVITERGIIMGTPRYMSPEQARGLSPDHRTDLYSVGIMLYELLTGKPPFVHKNPMQIIRQHVQDEPRPPRAAAPDAEIPAYAEAIVLRALAKDRDERFQSAHEFVAAIDEAEQAESTAEQEVYDGPEEAAGEVGSRGGGRGVARWIYLGVGIGVAVSVLVGLVVWMAVG